MGQLGRPLSVVGVAILKRILFLLLIPLILCGCSTSAEPDASTASTSLVPYEVISTTMHQLESKMSKYGDCHVFLQEKDGFLEASFSLDCYIVKSTFYDYLTVFVDDVLQFAEENTLEIENIHVGFVQNGTTKSYLLVWDSADGLTGSLVDTTTDGRVEKECTPADIKEYYGSAGFTFP